LEDFFYEMALKVSGAVEARRWSGRPMRRLTLQLNGPHSLFVDTIRFGGARLSVAHLLGHALMAKTIRRISCWSGRRNRAAPPRNTRFVWRGRDY